MLVRRDSDFAWQIVYAVEPEAIVILEVFAKKIRATPHRVIETCRRRLSMSAGVARKVRRS